MLGLPTAMERVYTLESTSILQLSRNDFAATSPRLVHAQPPGADPGGAERLIQLIRRERLDRRAGDFLEIGSRQKWLAALAEAAGKKLWVIQRDAAAQIPEETRLAFALVDENRDPAQVKNDFRLVWKHLIAGGWAGFDGYAGAVPEVTAVLNSLLTEHSAEIDRVERIKEKSILLVRKRTSRTEWKKL